MHPVQNLNPNLVVEEGLEGGLEDMDMLSLAIYCQPSRLVCLLVMSQQQDPQIDLDNLTKGSLVFEKALTDLIDRVD
jgi:hypothetical protein